MRQTDPLDRLDSLIESRSILQHPFYAAWQHGTLTRAQLQTYASAYYAHVVSFPRYLQAAACSATDPLVREELEHNLFDELCRPKPHSELWLDFAAGIGLNRQAVADAPPRPAAMDVVTAFDRLTRDETIGAVSALYAYESQQPEVSRQKVDGLRRYYGVDSPEALAYFEVHAEADIEHRNGERQALSRCLAAGASADVMLSSAAEALDAYWGLLDGILQEAPSTFQ